MSSFDLKTYLSTRQSLVEKALEKYVSINREPRKIFESMHYSLMAGGKRIRPILCLSAHELLGGNPQNVMAAACALEMIHTFSLIHDDLPAMDDDNFRRGIPTNHKVFGEALAILAGDGLHALAFEVFAELSTGPFDPKVVLDVIKDLADATGALGMVGGQVLDMEATGKKLAAAELAELHRLKTGRLISVSGVIGAKLASSDTTKIAAIERYGKAVGLAFQVADDVLDIVGGDALGKDVGSDLENGKMTYVALLGLDGAKNEAQRLKNEALQALSPFGEEAEPLRSLASYIVDRKN